MSRRYREEWKEFDSATRSAGWRIFLWVAAILVGAGVLTAGIVAVRTATSDVRGQAETTQKINSAENRIAAQETFEALYRQVLAYDQQLDQAAKDKTEHPKDPFFATNYSGLVKTCIDARNQYDADARKITRAKWLSPDLPYQLDPNNPETDCKESAR